MTPPRSLRLALLGAAAIAFADVTSVQAQPASFSGAPTGPVVADRPDTKLRQAPPPALPGAKTNTEVARPERLPSDMPPTEALFDAINRGDIATARDAINRGADLNGRNILGMSPTALSVDLGRNDITFLLLSLRGGPTGDSRSAASAPPLAGKRGRATTTAEAAPPRLTRQQQAAARQASRPAAAPSSDEFGDAPVAVAPAPVPPRRQTQAAATPAGSGTPIPQMGFLGFGGAAR